MAIPSRAAFFTLTEEAPFSQGELLFGASEFVNDVLPHGQTPSGPVGMDLLAYAVVMGPGAVRVRSGWGKLARLVIRPLRSGLASIRFVQSPIYPAQVVLEDGLGERYFQRARGIDICVKKKTVAKDTRGLHQWGAVKIQAVNRGGP